MHADYDTPKHYENILARTCREELDYSKFISANLIRSIFLKKGDSQLVMKLDESVEVDFNLERWLDKWEFLLHNDRDLTQDSATFALKQLDEIISYEWRKGHAES
jgi:hypothetical protein